MCDLLRSGDWLGELLEGLDDSGHCRHDSYAHLVRVGTFTHHLKTIFSNGTRRKREKLKLKFAAF